MSTLPTTEKARRAWAFAAITGFWVLATLMVVYHLAPKADSDTELRRNLLTRSNGVLDEQKELLQLHDNLSQEIKATRFEIYQAYVVIELEEKVIGLWKENTPVAFHSKRISQILLLLLRARQELVAKLRNYQRIGDELQNCREGNTDIRIN
jgi:hypothetical protein